MKLRFQQGDISAVANPPAGQFVVMYDTDGKLKQKDSTGLITEIGSGNGGGNETNYPTIDALKAGERFWYKGNEWHYMTQNEIDSIGWPVGLGFPSPVNKNLCKYIYFTGATLQLDFEGLLNLVVDIVQHNLYPIFLCLDIVFLLFQKKNYQARSR